MPFQLQISEEPNETTLRAFADIDAGRGRYVSDEEFRNLMTEKSK